ncbi:unnamed protein product, partial [Lymnaea stagnalis]
VNCKCLNSQYFDGTCKTRPSYGGKCSTAIPCLNNMECINRRCECTENQFLDVDNFCRARMDYNSGSCASNSQCKPSLTCNNDLCVCNSTQYYDTNDIICKTSKSYGMACTTTG